VQFVDERHARARRVPLGIEFGGSPISTVLTSRAPV
jgi:hypothetical protein